MINFIFWVFCILYIQGFFRFYISCYMYPVLCIIHVRAIYTKLRCLDLV